MGEEKSLSRLLLAVAIFLFFCDTQNPLYVVFGCEQLYHFFPCPLLFRVAPFVLCGEGGILLFQRLDGGQLLQTKGIKVPLCRLTGIDLTGMLFIKLSLFFARQFPILYVSAPMRFCSFSPNR